MGHVPFFVKDIKPSRQNNLIYQPFGIANDDDRGLVNSIHEHGVVEPLVISQDNYLLSGHRRLSAATYLGIETVPVRIDPIQFEPLPAEEKLRVLQRFNQQRAKTFDELVREQLVLVDPKTAHRTAIRQAVDRINGPKLRDNIELGERKKRAKITTTEFRDAVLAIVKENEQYWPLTDRRIHYLLLNKPPRRHDRKPGRYENTHSCYKALVSLLTRLRLDGQIPMRAIEDPTRPVLNEDGFDSPADFIAHEIEYFLGGYRRNLMQGQSVHVEIVLEKAALRTIVEAVAREYGIPVTTTRGYCSLAPRYDLIRRFKRTGKSKLVLLMMTDFDPDGEQIASSFVSSLRDDFGLKNVTYTKVLLTAEDVIEHDLPSDMDAKESSPQYSKFVARHGYKAVELDAVPVTLIQARLRSAINSAIDIGLYNQQVVQEEKDAALIEAKRLAALGFIKGA
jgi:ParB-like chromosome segregation protein Spo0J